MSASPRDERAFQAIRALLDHLHPKADNAALVASLREHFASADALFSAGPGVLERLGLSSGDALLLGRLPELSRCIQRGRFEARPQLAHLPEAGEYLVALFHGLQVERFYLLCLNERGRLIERVLMQEGTSDTALFSLRRMLAEAIRTDASALVISHNHPSLTLRPSQDDVACTADAIRALTAVGIPLLDHIIVAGRQAVSLRQNGFVPAHLWLRQCPDLRLLQNWLEEAPKRRPRRQ